MSRSSSNNLSAVREAREIIFNHAIRTPLIRLNTSSAQADIYLKLENLQPIGSFKIRGSANAISRLSQRELEQGVVTASAGNWLRCRLDREDSIDSCTVIAPDTAPEVKLNAIKRGGRVIGSVSKNGGVRLSSVLIRASWCFHSCV